jgi:hypothetical protein
MNNSVVYIVRKGHLGDVILTEPIARTLKAAGHTVVLVTEYTHLGPVLPTYDAAKPYEFYLRNQGRAEADSFLILAYELYPELHYIDGFAKCAGVSPLDRYPVVRGGSAPIEKGAYCLLAPHTSPWCRQMREWDYQKFRALASLITTELGTPIIFLKPQHSFQEMLSLVEHCSLFIGNDSGPGILAQAYRRPALILFGATDPSKVLFAPEARPILVDVGCNGCRQWNRNSPVECNTPLCLNRIDPDRVLSAAASQLSLESIVSRGKR